MKTFQCVIRQVATFKLVPPKQSSKHIVIVHFRPRDICTLRLICFIGLSLWHIMIHIKSSTVCMCTNKTHVTKMQNIIIILVAFRYTNSLFTFERRKHSLLYLYMFVGKIKVLTICYRRYLCVMNYVNKKNCNFVTNFYLNSMQFR